MSYEMDDYVDTDERCPACGSPIDYCQGHGDIGDPFGAMILEAHDDGDHTQCHTDGCDVAADYAARVARLSGKF